MTRYITQVVHTCRLYVALSHQRACNLRFLGVLYMYDEKNE